MNPLAHIQRLWLPTALVLILCLQPAYASQNVQLLGVSEGGASRANCIDGGYGYVGFANVIVVKDVSFPDLPVEVTEILVADDVLDLAVGGNYLYAAASEAGLCIIDVSNPSEPIEVGILDTPGEAVGVALSGTYAYVADAAGGLRVIDVSNPAAPSEVSANTSIGVVNDVYAEGSYVYASGVADLSIFDISTPESPSPLGTYDATGTSRAVAVTGNYAYVLSTSVMRVVDISNKLAPGLQSSLSVTNPNDIALSAGFAYVGADWLHIIDISNPLVQPSYVSSYYGGGQGMGTSILGSYAYAAFTEGGLTVLNVSNPQTPLAVFKQPGWDMARDLFIDGDYAYVAADRDLLRIVDLANPETPVEVGRLNFGTETMTAITVAGNYAYLGEPPVGASTAPLHIVDVSNPLNPVYQTAFEDFNNRIVYNKLVARDGYLYAAKGSFGLRVYNISNPLAPVLAAQVVTGGLASDIVLDGNYGYLLDGSLLQGVRILDITPPGSAAEIGTYITPGVAKGAAVQGNYLFVADEGNGLLVLDITTPATPVKVGELLTIPGASDVSVHGGFAYVVDGTSSVRAVDISDPTQPAEVGFFDQTSGGVLRVEASGDDVFLLDQFTGLLSLRNLLVASGIGDRLPAGRSALAQNFPNPFNPATTIRYTVSQAGPVSLRVYDARGRLIRTLVDKAQDERSVPYTAVWDGRDDDGTSVTSGVYYYRLMTPDRRTSRSMVLLK